MDKITVSNDRMHIQEIALYSLVRLGLAHKKQCAFGKIIYKVQCENPWTRSDGSKVKGLR